MDNEFETRKFNIEEIAKFESGKDFSNNPEASKYIKTEQKEEKKFKLDKKVIALIGAGLVVLIIIFSILSNTLRNDVFYKAPEKEVQEEVIEKVPEKEVIEITEPETEPEIETEKEICPYKHAVGNYILESDSPDLGKLSYNVYVSNINDEGRIIFSIAMMNEDSKVLYETGSITGYLDDNKVEFKWGDNHGNSGEGELSVFDSSITIRIEQLETADGNIATLATDTPLSIVKKE